MAKKYEELFAEEFKRNWDDFQKRFVLRVKRFFEPYGFKLRITYGLRRTAVGLLTAPNIKPSYVPFRRIHPIESNDIFFERNLKQIEEEMYNEFLIQMNKRVRILLGEALGDILFKMISSENCFD